MSIKTSLFLLSSLIFFSQTLNGQNCNCSEFLYLNDTGLNYVEKFKINADGSLTEIGSPWLNAAGIVDFPHGIASDVNGNVYIGETDPNNGELNIQKFSCTGEKLDADLSTPAIDNFTNDGFGYSQFTVGNLLYVAIDNSGGSINIYDLCTGDNVGCMREGYIWGHAAGVDGYWYATGFGNANSFAEVAIFRGLLDPAAYTDGNGGCGSFELVANASKLGIPNGSRPQGIAQGPDGSLYVTVSAGGGFNPPSYILKIDVNGNILAQSPTDNQIEGNSSDNLNWGGSRGIVYNNGYLYVSSGDDCIAVFDANTLTYQPGLSVNVQGVFPKQIGLTRQCCPVNDSFVVDTIICSGSLNATFSLQDIIKCAGSACEGSWAEGITDPNVVYDACNSSISVNFEENSCTSFTLSAGNANANSQCSQFTVELNLESASLSPATVSADQSICDANVPQALAAVSPTAGVAFQWQQSTSSCNTGFTNISNATSATYSPPVLNQTTYFKVITTLAGNCSSKSCSTESNCVTISVDGSGQNCIREYGEFTIIKKIP